jgi:ATPase subunit of ABC transporter with duplicated ATPase domains
VIYKNILIFITNEENYRNFIKSKEQQQQQQQQQRRRRRRQQQAAAAEEIAAASGGSKRQKGPASVSKQQQHLLPRHLTDNNLHKLHSIYKFSFGYVINVNCSHKFLFLSRPCYLAWTDG